MKNRFSKLSGKALAALLLTAASGISTSCKDEYTLDDEKPSWLHSSIYETLQQDGNYTNYVRLLSDPDVNPTNARPLTEVLSRTGSKTVFVANDDAWKEFFAKNATLPETDPWHTATSYENLSVSQKKLLIHTSMLNNAIVMENLASNEGETVTRGEFMRRFTDFETTDTITFLSGNSLPVNYNLDNGEADYWWRFREENGGKGVYVVCDSSRSMMVHFTSEHMTKNNVTDEDFAIIMGRERTTEDVHIYDALLLEKDGVAENGYVNTTEKPLKPLANMAELIRTNGESNIFSHMLERFSAPFFNKPVTEAYKDVMAARGITWTDSIFSKRYFCKNKNQGSYGHAGLETDPNGIKFRDDRDEANVFLEFDPGWNEFYGESAGPQYDMAAMYVPNDKALWEYFTEGGGGWNLIQTFYLKKGTANEIPYERPSTQEELFWQIDQIPISVLTSLINNIMFRSFVGSVPSKMTKLRDDAQEQLFYSEDKEHIQHCLLANNGVIYLMDKVYGPADYTSVAAPAYTTNTNLVMNFAIYNGNSGTDYMGLNYYAYLKAMRSRFALFLPSDDALRYYYDPTSFKSTKKRVISFYYEKGTFPVKCDLYNYNPETGEIGQLYTNDRINTTNAEGRSDVVNRLKDILESHTIVITDGSDEINTGVDTFYLAKNGSPVKVIRETGADGTLHITKVQGPFQVENEKNGIEGFVGASNQNRYTTVKGVQHNEVTDEQTMANGVTYILDSPIIPAPRSVYNILTNDGKFDSPHYGSFYKLAEINDEIIKACGLVDTKIYKNKKQQETQLKKYSIFSDEKGPDFNVQFFNNFNYTAFIPTNDAVEDAISKGLPTWEDLEADYEDMMLVVGELDSLRDEMGKSNYVDKAEDHQRMEELLPIAHNDSLLLQTKVTYLLNFLRYHFVDNSVFADNSAFGSTEYVTSSYDNLKGLFCKVHIRRPGDGTLLVQDTNDSPWYTAQNVNVMARDISCSKKPNSTSMNGVTIDGSSFIVIHQIPGVLNHATLTDDGRYDSTWSTPEKARQYLKRYAIH